MSNDPLFVDKVRDTGRVATLVRVVAHDYGSARCRVAASSPTDRFSEDSRAGRS